MQDHQANIHLASLPIPKAKFNTAANGAQEEEEDVGGRRRRRRRRKTGERERRRSSCWMVYGVETGERLMTWELSLITKSGL